MKQLFLPVFVFSYLLFSCENANNQKTIKTNFDDPSNLESADTFNYCCEALGFEFHPHKKRMANFLADNWEPYTSTEFGGKSTHQIIEEENCVSCGFVNKDASSTYAFMRLTSDSNGNIRYVKLNFSERDNEQTNYAHNIFNQLKKDFGAPSDSAVWLEEAFKHFSYKWDRNCCVLYYDFGGLENKNGQVKNLQPTWLIFEAKPVNNNFQDEVISEFKR